MQRRWITASTAALGGVALLLTAASPASAIPERRADIPRETLADGDGWAAAGTGTTGGSAATPEHVFTVGDRAGLVAAVAGDEPKIVIVSGVIDANTDDAGAPLTCADYARDGYTLDAYLAAYDPAVWGWDQEPSGPIEDARAASQAAQRARIDIRVGANTTLIGLPAPRSRAPPCRSRTSRTSSSAASRSRTRTTASRRGTRPTARPATGTPSRTC